jgi:hypothetical protein
MKQGNRVRAIGRVAAVFALAVTLPACSENNDWDDLSLPLLMWTQEEGSWQQPSSHCVYTHLADAEWSAWQDDWCETPDGEVSPLGGMSPAARTAIQRGFEDLKRAEPQGRSTAPCQTNRRHTFILHEPVPMLEEPTTWTAWEICAGARDDLANVEEPFATIAKAFLDR